MSQAVLENDCDIAKHEVSEDGVHWRPYDPAADRGRTLHRRIEFAPPDGIDEGVLARLYRPA